MSRPRTSPAGGRGGPPDAPSGGGGGAVAFPATFAGDFGPSGKSGGVETSQAGFQLASGRSSSTLSSFLSLVVGYLPVAAC